MFPLLFPQEQNQQQFPVLIPLPPSGSLPACPLRCPDSERCCLHAPRSLPWHPWYLSIPPGWPPGAVHPAGRRSCIPPDKPAGGEDGGAGNRKDGHKEPFGLKNFFHIAVISFFLSVYPLRFYSKVFQQRFDIIEHWQFNNQKSLPAALRRQIRRKVRKPARAVKRVAKMNFLDVNSFFIRGKLLS